MSFYKRKNKQRNGKDNDDSNKMADELSSMRFILFLLTMAINNKWQLLNSKFSKKNI